MSVWVLWLAMVVAGGSVTETAERASRKVRAVCPDADVRTVEMMGDEVSAYRHVVPEDVAIAVAWVETRCTHLKVRGAAGEWGILQVIPYEGHILQIAEEYRCSPEEMVEKAVQGGALVPVCDADGKLNVRRGGKVIPWRVEAVVKGNARVAFRVGLRELGVWKTLYENVLYGQFWRVYPAWMENRVPDPAGFRGWWYSVKSKLGPDAWVVHHNYGPRLVSGPVPRSYPFRVLRGIEQVRGVE